jgi:hypothetical protein
MHILQYAVPAVVISAGILLNSSASYGTVAMSKQEKKACTACHTKAGSKELNDAGKAYQKDHKK